MRKSSVVYAIVTVGVLAAALVTYQRVSATTSAVQRSLDMEKLKRGYLERVGWMREGSDAQKFQSDVKLFLASYFADVDALVKKHALNPKFDDYLRAREQSAEKAAPVADPAVGRAAFDRVSQTFQAMKEGRYTPLLTATDQGLRLDVVSGDLRSEAGGQVVFPIVLWGAQTEIHEDRASRTQKAVALVSMDATWKLFDAAGKLKGEIHVGNPSLRIDYPERFIPLFPPQMVLGEYRIDRVPAEAETMEMAVDVTARASWGSVRKSSFSWKVPVKREWKLAPGEAWQGAMVTERSEDEINPQDAGVPKK